MKSQLGKGKCGALRWKMVFTPFLLALLLLLFSPHTYSQSHSWEAAGKIGGGNPEGGQNIVAGPDGTFYMVAKFQTQTSVGGSVYMAQAGNESYLVKMDTSGTIHWSIGILGDALRETVRGMELDDAGNLYMTGDFESYVEIDSILLTSSYQDGKSSYLVRISPTGNVDWMREVGISPNMFMSGLEIDNQNRIFVGGQYADTIVVDTDTLLAEGGSDFFVSSFNQQGQSIWSRSFGSSDFDIAWGFGGNGQGNLGFSGLLLDTARINSTLYGIPGTETMVIIRLDRDGNDLGVIYEPQTSSQFDLLDIDINEFNELFIGGNFVDTIHLGGQFLVSSGSKDVVLAKFMPNDTLGWMTKGGGSDLDELKGLEVDQYGDVYITGYYVGFAQFDTQFLSSFTIIGDYYMAKYRRQGGIEWIENANVGFFDYASGFDLDLWDGLIFLTGEFTSTATFGGSYTLSSSGTSDLFWGAICQQADATVDSTLTGPLCIGQTFPVDYRVFGCFDPNNSMTIQLSDANGSFSLPMDIGVDSSNTSGSVEVTLPISLQPGNGYRLRMVSSNPVVITDDNGTDLQLGFFNNVNIATNGDTAICQGESVILDAGPGFSTYAWSTGAATQTINVNTGGTYTLSVIDTTGCISQDTIMISGPHSPPPAPQIMPGDSSVICTNGSLNLDAGNGYFSYLWNTGDTVRVITITSPGTFHVMVTNGFGCEGFSDTISIYSNTPPTISRIGDTLVSSPAVSYQWYLGPSLVVGATNQTYVPVQNGPYSVKVIDFNGCSEVSDTLDFLVGQMGPGEEPLITVFPQPAVDRITVKVSGGANLKAIGLADLAGRVVKNWDAQGNSSIILNTAGLPAGSYLLKLETSQGTLHQRVIISR